MSVLQALGKTHSVHISADFSLCALLSSQGIFVRDKTHTCALGGRGWWRREIYISSTSAEDTFLIGGVIIVHSGGGLALSGYNNLKKTDYLPSGLLASWFYQVLQGNAGNWVFDVVHPPPLSKSGRIYFKSQSFTIFNPKLWGKVLNLVWFKSVAMRNMWINQRWNLN